MSTYSFIFFLWVIVLIVLIILLSALAFKLFRQKLRTFGLLTALSAVLILPVGLLAFLIGTILWQDISCVRQNGAFIRNDKFIEGFCSPLTSDGGKACTDSEQCEGYCLCDSIKQECGKCSVTERTFCPSYMEDGKCYVNWC